MADNDRSPPAYAQRRHHGWQTKFAFRMFTAETWVSAHVKFLECCVRYSGSGDPHAHYNHTGTDRYMLSLSSVVVVAVLVGI